MQRLGPVQLLVLDGDHTLWWPTDVTCASERYPDDPEGADHFAFAPDPANPDRIIRDDGVRFDLLPDARATLDAATAAGIGLAMASWNHHAPIRAMLAAYGLLPRFRQVWASWTSDKETMLREILAAEAAAGRPLDPATLLFVDDDPFGLYRPMAAAVGVQFLQMGHPAELAGWPDLAKALGLAVV
jgi:predicted phosphatase